jgi:hypothetical protein
VFTLAKRFDDEGKIEKSEEEEIEFLEAGEDSAEAFESREEPLDFVALLVESAVIFPGADDRRSQSTDPANDRRCRKFRLRIMSRKQVTGRCDWRAAPLCLP